MMRFLVQFRNIFVKGYGFLSFAKNMSKNTDKSQALNLVKKFLIILNKLQQMLLKLLQKEQFKKSKAIGDLIGN